MSDEATEVAAVANTATAAIHLVGNAGAYLSRIMGSIPENLLGIAGGDYLQERRKRNLATLELGTAAHLNEIGAKFANRLTEPSPNVLIPLLQAAQDEGRPELQAMWSSLLANVMLDGGKRVRRDFFDALKQMEPSDAAVFNKIIRMNLVAFSLSDRRRFINEEMQKLAIANNDVAISLLKLSQLNLISPEPQFIPTPFGRGFFDACQLS